MLLGICCEGCSEDNDCTGGQTCTTDTCSCASTQYWDSTTSSCLQSKLHAYQKSIFCCVIYVTKWQVCIHRKLWTSSYSWTQIQPVYPAIWWPTVNIPVCKIQYAQTSFFLPAQLFNSISSLIFPIFIPSFVFHKMSHGTHFLYKFSSFISTKHHEWADWVARDPYNRCCN